MARARVEHRGCAPPLTQPVPGAVKVAPPPGHITASTDVTVATMRRCRLKRGLDFPVTITWTGFTQTRRGQTIDESVALAWQG